MIEEGLGRSHHFSQGGLGSGRDSDEEFVEAGSEACLQTHQGLLSFFTLACLCLLHFCPAFCLPWPLPSPLCSLLSLSLAPVSSQSYAGRLCFSLFPEPFCS